MEIKLNTNVDPIGRAPGTQPKKVEAQAPSEGAVFSHAEDLNRGLQQTEDVRTEKVAQARALVNQTNYPPKETIKKIATLLAANIAKEKPNTAEI